MQRTKSFYEAVLALLCHQGVRLVMYLDDMLAGERRPGETIAMLLESLGAVVNREKSQVTSSQTIQYLGFLIDSRDEN